MGQFVFAFEERRNLLSVTELNQRIRNLLDSEFSDVWVTGEISGVKLSNAGHYYFTLKDRESSIRCVCFRMSARFLKFKPQDGVSVNLRGRIDVYEARGEYQLIAEFLEPQGYGALQFAFEQLKKKLAAEGLFEQARKKPLPRLPRRIGIVTSPSGAVFQDMVNILSRRFPGLHIRLFPALVQGEGSVAAVRRGIEYFSEVPWADVVIVARGGGSLEDLWTFNEEEVARAIVASPVPVISAVGHETDFTIADFVADLRAPTPSAAAELVVCTREQLLESVEGCRRKLLHAIQFRIGSARHALQQRGTDRATLLLHRMIGRAQMRTDELDFVSRERITRTLRARRERWSALDARLRASDLRLKLAAAHRRLEAATVELQRLWQVRVNADRRRLESLTAHLTQLSPVKVLERGYAIVRDEQGHVVRDVDSVTADQRLRVRVATGEFSVRVDAE